MWGTSGSSPGSRCSTSRRARSAGGASRSARRGTPASPSARSSSSWGCATTCSARRIRLLAGDAREADALVPSVIDPDVLWSCTTCGACVEECPVDIEHIDAIVDMRRYEVLMESRFPTEAGLLLRNLENQGDPWGLGAAKRTDWLAEPRLRGAGGRRHDPRRRRVPLLGGLCGLARRARPQAGRLDGADAAPRRGHLRDPRSEGVLHGGPGPPDGQRVPLPGARQGEHRDPARRGRRKIVATCPHCFNSIRNEYPALGGDFEVIHHAQLLDHLVRDGRLTPGHRRTRGP